MSRKDGLLTSGNCADQLENTGMREVTLATTTTCSSKEEDLRLVIPETLRQNVLRYLHDAHQSISETRENTASSVWWCGLSRDIEKMLQNCDMFPKFRVEKIEPVRSTPFQNWPWGKVAADFFVHKGHNYLLVVDYYSRHVEICLVSRGVNTAETILRMKKVFGRHGICDTLITDNGLQFTSNEIFKFL